MVSGQVPGGGTEGLLNLIDRFGEAIESDLHRVYGIRLIDWFRGVYSTGEIVRRIRTLPPGSALEAAVRAEPGYRPEGKPEAWREYAYAETPQYALRAVWALLAAANTPKGKKPPKFPEPGQSAGRPLLSMAPIPRGG